jgi:hypothetical protein
MSYALPLLPALVCVAMMFGAVALVWLGTRTPLRRVPWFARRARHTQSQRDHVEGA